jgi:hypothetical protein
VKPKQHRLGIELREVVITPEDCEQFNAVLLAMAPIPTDGWEYHHDNENLLNIYSVDMYDKYMEVRGFFGQMGMVETNEARDQADKFFWWYWKKIDEFRRNEAIEELSHAKGNGTKAKGSGREKERLEQKEKGRVRLRSHA